MWRWNDELDWWELPNSDRSDCICAQYVLYKLLGLVPDPDLVIEDVDLELSDPSFLEWLEENGFRPAEGGPRTEGAPPQCGCGDGRQTACVVLYRDSQGGAPIHVAAFDAKLCDWGGKLSGPGGIVRFCDAGSGGCWEACWWSCSCAGFFSDYEARYRPAALRLWLMSKPLLAIHGSEPHRTGPASGKIREAPAESLPGVF